MAVKYFEELEVWKASRALASAIYGLTSDGLFSKDYGLRDQIRRASVSVMSNIAEGYERGGKQELIQFLSIAKGSCGDVRCQMYVAIDQGYVSKQEGDKLIEQCKKVSIMIHNFMEYLKGSRYTGVKYKNPPRKSVKEEMEEIYREVMNKNNKSV